MRESERERETKSGELERSARERVRKREEKMRERGFGEFVLHGVKSQTLIHYSICCFTPQSFFLLSKN